MGTGMYGYWPSADTALRAIMEVINISSHLDLSKNVNIST